MKIPIEYVYPDTVPGCQHYTQEGEDARGDDCGRPAVAFVKRTHAGVTFHTYYCATHAPRELPRPFVVGRIEVAR